MSYPISDVTRRVVYSGSAGTGPYTFTFEVLANTDIAVYKNTTLLTLTTDYTVTINTDGTGYVTLVSAAISTDNITLVGDRSIERATDFVTGGDLFANSLNDEFDSLVIFSQQVDEKVVRSIKAPVTDPVDIDMELPSKINRASKYLAFDADGNPIATEGTDTSVAYSDFAKTLVDDASAADMRNTLGLAIGTNVQAYSSELQGASQGGIKGFKNRIINGAMQISQRTTSATVTAGTAVPTTSTGYPCVDRFFVYSTGANVTAAQVAGSGSVKNRLQITGAASVTAVGVGHRVEKLNSYDMAGSVCTLSVDMANSLLTTVTWTASYANTDDTFGTIGTPTKTQIATGTFTVTSTVTNYTTNITVPSDATTGIEILFTVGAQTSGTWTVGNVQLEKGSTATSFDVRPYGAELALCQRYAQRWCGVNTYDSIATGFWTSATIGTIQVPLKTTMRTQPSLTTSGAFCVVIASGGVQAISTFSLDTNASNINTAYINYTTASGGTTGQGTALLAQNSTSSSFVLSSEL